MCYNSSGDWIDLNNNVSEKMTADENALCIYGKIIDIRLHNRIQGWGKKWSKFDLIFIIIWDDIISATDMNILISNNSYLTLK